MKRQLWHKQLIRFGIVGLCATTVYVVAGFLLLNGVGLPLMASNIGAFFASLIVSYLGHSLWSFEARSEIKSMLKFAVLCVIALTTSVLISHWVTVSGISANYGIVITAVVIPIISFTVQKLWIFQK